MSCLLLIRLENWIFSQLIELCHTSWLRRRRRRILFTYKLSPVKKFVTFDRAGERERELVSELGNNDQLVFPESSTPSADLLFLTLSHHAPDLSNCRWISGFFHSDGTTLFPHCQLVLSPFQWISIHCLHLAHWQFFYAVFWGHVNEQVDETDWRLIVLDWDRTISPVVQLLPVSSIRKRPQVLPRNFVNNVVIQEYQQKTVQYLLVTSRTMAIGRSNQSRKVDESLDLSLSLCSFFSRHGMR